MEEWIYKLDAALLREAINKDTPFITLGVIATVVKRFNAHMDNVNAFPDKMKEDFFQFYTAIATEFANGEDELYNYVVIDECIAANLTEYIDFRLAELYDLCKEWKVWLVM